MAASCFATVQTYSLLLVLLLFHTCPKLQNLEGGFLWHLNHWEDDLWQLWVAVVYLPTATHDVTATQTVTNWTTDRIVPWTALCLSAHQNRWSALTVTVTTRCIPDTLICDIEETRWWCLQRPIRSAEAGFHWTVSLPGQTGCHVNGATLHCRISNQGLVSGQRSVCDCALFTLWVIWRHLRTRWGWLCAVCFCSHWSWGGYTLGHL